MVTNFSNIVNPKEFAKVATKSSTALMADTAVGTEGGKIWEKLSPAFHNGLDDPTVYKKGKKFPFKGTDGKPDPAMIGEKETVSTAFKELEADALRDLLTVEYLKEKKLPANVKEADIKVETLDAMKKKLTKNQLDAMAKGVEEKAKAELKEGLTGEREEAVEARVLQILKTDGRGLAIPLNKILEATEDASNKKDFDKTLTNLKRAEAILENHSKQKASKDAYEASKNGDFKTLDDLKKATGELIKIVEENKKNGLLSAKEEGKSIAGLSGQPVDVATNTRPMNGTAPGRNDPSLAI